jgi:cyclophilin family peptidyl-prolyl cis-trans isomerase
MRFSLLSDWYGLPRSRRKKSAGPRSGRRLGLEQLETRQMFSVSLGSLQNIQVPGSKSVLVPLTTTDSFGGTVNYTFTSSNPNVQLSLVSKGSKSLVLNVMGTDNANHAFSGTLVLQLFEDLAPKTTARIEELVTSGYYNGLPFHRVLDGFVAQTGQTNNGNDTGVLLADELSATQTFVSPGLLAMANRGRDTADAEFFITAIDGAGSTNPITLANMPQSLNSRYTIFGQLVKGFDTFEKIMSAHVIASPNNPLEISKPSPSITITSASLITDTQDAVLRVFAPTSLVGSSATITVTATNSHNETSQKTFTGAAVANSHVDPPFLGAVNNQVTTKNTAVTFNLTSTNPSAAAFVYKIADATTFGTPANVTISINQATGQVTLTPATDFTGTIKLLAGVRASADADAKENYDTQAFSLAVGVPSSPTGLAIDAASRSGAFENNGYITTGTPKLTVTAPTGSTVKFKLGSTVVGTGVETANGSGIFTATLPAGMLAVGTNSITATAANTNGTSADSTALSFIFAPNVAGGVYVVPGAAGSTQTLTFDWMQSNAAFNNEFGYFVVDKADGSIGGITPGSAGYAQAALSSTTRAVLFAKGKKAGATTNVTLHGGQMVVFYLIQDNTTANFLARNPSDVIHGNGQSRAPLAVFSLQAANPDHVKHAQIIADSLTGRAQFNWEDLVNLGDSDFNDASIVVHAAGSATQQGAVHAPGTGATSVTLKGTLHGEKQATPSGDVGVYFADDPTGKIGSLKPGDEGYAAAALASTNVQVLFGSAATGTKQVTVPAGKYLGFYLITSGTTADFIAHNATNSSAGARALFSFDAANPDGVNHFRWFTPGQQATDPNVAQLHAMTKYAGSAHDYDGFAIDLSFTA